MREKEDEGNYSDYFDYSMQRRFEITFRKGGFFFFLSVLPALPARFLIIFSSSLIVSQYWPPQHTAAADQRKKTHKLQGKEKYEESMTRTYSASE